MVVIQALTSAIFGLGIDKIVNKINEIKPKEIQIVNVKQSPNSYSITELDKVTTTNKKWTTKDNPNLEFENPLQKESVVKEISIIPDTNFKIKGKIRITIDDVDVFTSKSFTAFENVIDDTVKINKTINQDSKVKIFLISSDGTQVGVTIQVTFGE